MPPPVSSGPSRGPASIERRRRLAAPRIALLAIVLAVTIGAAPSHGGNGTGEGKGEPPSNVLILVADDLGTEILSAYGPQPNQPPTPTIDQLALDGVRFDRMWAAPVCTPARAALQTGRHSLRTGMGSLLGGLKDLDIGPFGLPLAETTMPELLSAGASGVWTAACIGKWHLASIVNGGYLSPNGAGYHHFAGTLGNLQGGESYTDWERVVDGFPANETGYATSVNVDDALAWIGQAPGPWLCVVNFNAPHVPFHAPPPALHTQDLSGAGAPDVDTRPYYNAMVEALDTEIGRLLAGLGTELDDTLVIFLADNGTPSVATEAPFDSTKVKGSFFEGGVRVPMIIRGPQVVTPGSTCDALVDITDIWATLADVAGINPASVVGGGVEIDGESLLPYLADPNLPSIKDYVFTEVFRPNALDGGLPVFFGTGPICQTDLGFGGPGTAVLSACGDVIGGDGSVDLSLTGAPALAPAFLAGSFFNSPVPAAGGWLVPFPQTAVFPIVTDAQGEFTLPGLASSVGPVKFYFQVAIVDAAQQHGYSISNAVELSIEPQNVKAIRGDRYKLVREYNGTGPERFFDLLTDPDELSNLLEQGPLGVDEAAAYAALSAELDAFLASY